MPRKLSEAQKAACQQNAQKSTGPRTEAGKAKARLNAVKHGLTAKLPVLPFEDEVEFQALKDGFEADFAPKNTYQRFLVHQLATHAWRILRSQQIEVGMQDLLLKQTLHRLKKSGHDTAQALEQQPYQGLALTLYPPQDDPHNHFHRNLFRYAREIHSQFHRTQKALADAQKTPKPLESTTPRFVPSPQPAAAAPAPIQPQSAPPDHVASPVSGHRVVLTE
jgi:hypothetical protein